MSVVAGFHRQSCADPGCSGCYPAPPVQRRVRAPGPKRNAAGESATQALTRRNREALEAGRHPATAAPLLSAEWGFACRDCSHLVHITNGNRSWWKCMKHRLGLSSSAASDVRVSWPACERFRMDGES